jgi:hypothetical protein
VYKIEPTADVLMVAGDQVPVIPLLELVGRRPGVAFKQYGPNCVNVGVILGVTVTVIVVITAHWPALGVNVYTDGPITVVFMLAGNQVPMMPFKEFNGSTSGVSFRQYGPNCVNVGVTIGLTVMVIVVTLAHCPTFGVKV